MAGTQKKRGSGNKKTWFTYNPNSEYAHDPSEYYTVRRKSRAKVTYKSRTSPLGIATGRKQTRRVRVTAKPKYTAYKRLKPARIVRRAKKRHGYNVYHVNEYQKGRFYQVVMSVTWIKYSPRGATYSAQRGYSDRRKLTDATFSEAKEQAFYRAYQACPFSPDDYKKPVRIHFLYYKKQ